MLALVTRVAPAERFVRGVADSKLGVQLRAVQSCGSELDIKLVCYSSSTCVLEQLRYQDAIG
jgi:hypothetical protein